jgi:hypothetical protein
LSLKNYCQDLNDLSENLSNRTEKIDSFDFNQIQLKSSAQTICHKLYEYFPSDIISVFRFRLEKVDHLATFITGDLIDQSPFESNWIQHLFVHQISIETSKPSEIELFKCNMKIPLQNLFTSIYDLNEELFSVIIINYAQLDNDVIKAILHFLSYSLKITELNDEVDTQNSDYISYQNLLDILFTTIHSQTPLKLLCDSFIDLISFSSYAIFQFQTISQTFVVLFSSSDVNPKQVFIHDPIMEKLLLSLIMISKSDFSFSILSSIFPSFKYLIASPLDSSKHIILIVTGNNTFPSATSLSKILYP